MLRRWDDSQRFLADMPQLICEETANYLILWSMRLQQEGVRLVFVFLGIRHRILNIVSLKR